MEAYWETNAIIVLPDPTNKRLRISIACNLKARIVMEYRLTLSRAPQTRGSLLGEPRLEIWVIKEPVCGASESFLTKSLMDFFVIIT